MTATAKTQLQRTTFKTSRLLEFFTEKELTMQIGYGRGLWPIALVKELIDNALDACESANIQPCITVSIEDDFVSVEDNGPGLPSSTLEQSLDYLERVSDKAHYVSPSRGQLGNALKCVWAAPYVADGQHGKIEVSTGGQTHHIDVTLDRIAQAPDLAHSVEADGVVKNGTLVKIHWADIASYLLRPHEYGFYNVVSARALVARYAFFNPHAGFHLLEYGDYSVSLEPYESAWLKWKPNNPTSPHWYSDEQIKSLIAAYVKHERESDSKPRTVREFVSEFAGLSGTAKQKAVTEAAGLSGLCLRDLIESGDISSHKALKLLTAMQQHSREIKAPALGVLGREFLEAIMQAGECAGVRYQKTVGTSDGVPFVLEVAFGVRSDEDCGRQIITGLNWTPALSNPIESLGALAGEMRIDRDDPVWLVVHLASPLLEFRDRGKASLTLTYEMSMALQKSIKAVAAEWKKAKLHTERISRQTLNHLRTKQPKAMKLKDAAYQVMEAAYMDASANGTLPANARQIMYSARPLVQRLMGGKLWENSSTFTQEYLPDYMKENPKTTAAWDVVFDARGQFIEPHTSHRVELGTLAVRKYVNGWHGEFADSPSPQLSTHCPTSGPANRYRHVLFVEKEGFNELWRAVDLARRYDLAIMSTKGMSVTAARQLVERLSERDITTFVLRDFDKSGFSIVHTLRSDTRRYEFKTTPKVIDLGVRLADVKKLKLQSEEVTYKGKADPRENLRASGATKAECNFLVRDGSPQHKIWYGERVELNALGSARLVEWLESKLQAAGVEKFIPNTDTLANAYRRAVRVARLQKLIDDELARDSQAIAIPDGLSSRVEKSINNSSLAWDDAVYNLACDVVKSEAQHGS